MAETIARIAAGPPGDAWNRHHAAPLNEATHTTPYEAYKKVNAMVGLGTAVAHSDLFRYRAARTLI